MKSTTIALIYGVLLITAAILCSNCNPKSNPGISYRDSTFTTVVLAFNWDQNEYGMSTALRYVRDSFGVKDSLYEIFISRPLVDSITKKQITDSSGRPVRVFQPKRIPKEFVIYDYNMNYK